MSVSEQSLQDILRNFMYHRFVIVTVFVSPFQSTSAPNASETNLTGTYVLPFRIKVLTPISTLLVLLTVATEDNSGMDMFVLLS